MVICKKIRSMQLLYVILCTFSFVEAIKHHLLQWFHEKNRKIEDGYNYEVNLFESLLVSAPFLSVMWLVTFYAINVQVANVHIVISYCVKWCYSLSADSLFWFLPLKIPHTPAKWAKWSEDSTNSSCSETWSTDSVQSSETEGRKCF
jgi:hypothetical protein